MTTVISRVAPWAAIAGGTAALSLRSPGWGSTPVVLLIGAAALIVRVPNVRVRTAWPAVVGVGVAALGAAHLSGGGVGVRTTSAGVAAGALAAVAEEALFRRALYGRLERFGPGVAVALCAVAFGVVHAPLYGWGVVPVDVAAGLLFGWQRWASGTWTAPAATHVFANLLG